MCLRSLQLITMLLFSQVLLHHPPRPAPAQRVQVRHHLAGHGRPLPPPLRPALRRHQAHRGPLPQARVHRADLPLQGQQARNLEVSIKTQGKQMIVYEAIIFAGKYTAWWGLSCSLCSPSSSWLGSTWPSTSGSATDPR